MLKFFSHSSAVLRAGSYIQPFFLMRLNAFGEIARNTAPAEISSLEYFWGLLSVAIFLAVAAVTPDLET